MPEITIEVSESLAERLSGVRDRLPEVLARGLDEPVPSLIAVYRYVLDFLAGDPSPQTIVNFKPTLAMQGRISELLEKNGEDQLTAAESVELDEYARIDTFLSLLKARAFRVMADPPQ